MAVLRPIAALLGGAALLLLSCARQHGNATISPKSAAAGERPLTASEKSLVAKNGFVISAEESPSFHLAYTAAFRAHQNVYFTADALLHAWHASYDSLLASMEVHALAPELNAMLAELRGSLAKSTAPEEAKKDVAAFLDMAVSLAQGKASSPAIEPLYKKAIEASGTLDVAMFGETMSMDLSMLKPRGHYTSGPILRVRPPRARAEERRVPRTPMWNRRILNTQLASWAELRHDNLLYAKESFTAVAACEYPDAYVDPYPSFYASMAKMADKGVATAVLLPLDDASRTRVTTYFRAARLDEPHGVGRRQTRRLHHGARGARVVCGALPRSRRRALSQARDRRRAHAADRRGRQPVGKVPYAEVVTENFARLTDEEWAQKERPLDVPWLSEVVAR